MVWQIKRGKQAGVDLAGLNVVVVVRTSSTLGFDGMADSQEARSVILVDSSASKEQHDALVEFAKAQSGKAGKHVERIATVPIQFSLDLGALTGELTAGKSVRLTTRKARPGDCICSNEAAYYPPIAKVEHCAPGVTIEGEVTARALGSRWSIPDTRTAYLATFSCE